MKKRGFTLIELLIVITIIGVLATIIIINYSSAQTKARDNKRKADIAAIASGIELYYTENKYYFSPTDPVVVANRDDVCKSIVDGAVDNSTIGTSEDEDKWNCYNLIYRGYFQGGLPVDPINKLGGNASWTTDYYYVFGVGAKHYCLVSHLETDTGNYDPDSYINYGGNIYTDCEVAGIVREDGFWYYLNK